MSEIIVKQLAQIVGTPIDVMLKQLQDAGVPVTSEDDSITDEQKLKLLEYIRQGQKKSTAPAKPKLSMGQRSVGGRKVTAAHSSHSVNVEVRRKKRTIRRPAADAADTEIVTNRSEEISRQLSEEREKLLAVKRSNDEAEQLKQEEKTEADTISADADADAVSVDEASLSAEALPISDAEKIQVTAEAETTEDPTAPVPRSYI